MKRLLSILLLLAVGLAPSATQTLADYWRQTPGPEVRAVWLTTLSGLDWPSRPATTPEGEARQQKELCDILNRLQAAGINTVIFQARIRSTTAYPSAIEPWDAAFTGKVGVRPGYDPLKLAVEECHKRHMELHAWVVAFPICKTAVERQLGKRALPRLRPELCRKSGDQWFMDPGVPGTADYLADICAEIVRNYDVDGIHLDYIRYPEESIAWNDRTTYRKYGAGQPLADWRRANVTRVVKRIHDAVKAIRPWVKMSCSPVGKYADLPRQNSYGWNARDAVCQEAQEWLRDGLMDMLFPMMYFDGRHFYPFAQDWQEQSAGRPVVPGLGIYFLSPKEKNWDLSVITRQLDFIRRIGLGGAAYFRSRFLTDNVKGLYDFVSKDYYSQPASLPPMTWADSIAPDAPKVRLTREGLSLKLEWETVKDNAPATPVSYNVYRLERDSLSMTAATLIARRLTETGFSYTPALPTALYDAYAVTAVDAYGNECALERGTNVVTAGELVAPKTNRCGRYLDLPDTAPDAPFLLVTDISGRAVCTMPYARRVDVSALAPGRYGLRSLAEKGVSHYITAFWKE